MNEHDKYGLPFSLAAQRPEIEDNETNVNTIVDLIELLIRRQLLAMESKEIDSMHRGAENWLKSEKEDLVRLRDYAVSFLHDHANRMEELVKINDHVADDQVAQDSRWLLPKVQQLNAWKEWLAEHDISSRRFRKDAVQIALVVSGGIGDLLKCTSLVAPVSDHFACDLTIITGQRAAGEISARNPYVRDVLTSRREDIYSFTHILRHIPVFDLIIVWKYAVQYIIPEGSRISLDDVASIRASSSDLSRALEKYCYLYLWPMVNCALSRDATRMGLSAMKVSAATSGLRLNDVDEIPFFPGKQSLRVIVPFLVKPYVTVHHGFDLKGLPPNTIETDYNSTKNISMRQWREIATLIKREGFEIVQLGTVEEEKIEGVTHYLNGLTTLEETGLLLKHGVCHIDTEGGLVHLANAVHARCVVLFGPTPAAFFGYPQNINLEPSGCKGCWFATGTWVVQCPRHTSGPECMQEHSAEVVTQAAKRIIADAERFTAKVTWSKTRPSSESYADALANVETLLDRDLPGRVLMILDESPCVAGIAISEGMLNQRELMVCSNKLVKPEPGEHIAGRFEYGSLLNLPRPASSIDAILWLSRTIESDVAPFALREMFRVLRPGGQLVFAAVGEATSLDLSQSTSAVRIALDEGGAASDSVYLCSLRKGATRPEGPPPLSHADVSTMCPQSTRGCGVAVDPSLALLEEENAREIAAVRDTHAEREMVAEEMHAVADEAIRRGFGRDGWVWVSRNFVDVYVGKFFIRGWHDAWESVIWSRETEDKCLLMAPYPIERSSPANVVELQIHLAVQEASASNPRTIGVRVDDGPVEHFRLATDDTILTVPISTESSRFRGVALIEFHLGDKTGDGEREPLRGNVRIGVKRFRYRLISSS